MKREIERPGLFGILKDQGKSFSMLFYTGAITRKLNNPTIVVLTDRNDLDDQLFGTFVNSRCILRETPKHADVRKLTEEQKKASAKKILKKLMDYLIYLMKENLVELYLQLFKSLSQKREKCQF